MLCDYKEIEENVKKFKRIFVEISNVCNLACTFCPPSNREHNAMSVENFEEVLKKLEGHGNHIYLHVKGEPLFHNNFKEILDLCHQYDKLINITTNGTLLDVQGQIILNNPSVRLVNISLQSFEDSKNETAYKAYLDRVLGFVKQGLAETKILFDLRLWNFDDGDLIADKDNQMTLEYIDNYLGLPEPLTVTDPMTKGLKLSSNAYISKGYEFEWPNLENDFVATRGKCFGLRHQIAILSTGEVVPCCLDADGVISLGNILETDFESIVTSERSTAIATGFENNKLIEPLCTRCSYRERFL